SRRPISGGITSSSTRWPGTTWPTIPTASWSLGSPPTPPTEREERTTGRGVVVRSGRVGDLAARPPRGPARRPTRAGPRWEDVGDVGAPGPRRRLAGANRAAP